MLRGERISLRPVEPEDLPLLESWVNDVDANGVYNDFGLTGRQGMGMEFAQSGFLDDRQGMLLAVLLTGEVIGSLSYRQVAYGPNRGSQAYAIGISLIAAQRGHGYGAEAQRLMAAYLFDTYPIARVEAETDVTNLAEQRSLEKAGFTREGVLRQAQWRAGARHDLALYSKLRGE
ncbi:MAG: GNAT family N-acetyltransferase [Anaerolineae bacterium]|nr:GNAT family N-acetyltransferase [Anaerolineae bacterium]